MRTDRSLIRAALMLLCVVLVPQAAFAATYYVDATATWGGDYWGPDFARNPNTPWRTIKRALSYAVAGDTIIVKPGTYMEAVESKRDGIATALITLKSSTAGAAIIRPPAGSNGFFISHNYHVIDGFTVTGAVTGLKLGAHDGGGGPVVGLLVQNNKVYGNSNNGIQFTNGLNGEIAFNTVYQNAKNGIEYEGNASLIHDNVVHDNGQFGLYIRDGVDHQVSGNQLYSNAGGDSKILGTILQNNRTFYVDSGSGSDAYTVDQAQSPATPWKTIKNALSAAQPGNTVLVQPGVYPEKVESKRDGTGGSPITLRAATAGTAVIQPPAGTNGFVITHNYHVLDGFAVTGAATGIQLGPHDGGDGPVSGLVAINNRVSGSSGAGIKFSNATSGSAMHNVVYGNGKDGIYYAGSGAYLFNNLVYGNGLALSGEYGITLFSGDSHQIVNNTVYGNANGGIRLSTNGINPVFSTVLNNIVAGNPVGIKEPAGTGYTGKATLDFNDVSGNTTANYDLSNSGASVPGPNSISLAPGFVDPANADFRLGRLATGQAADSPCIDRGSATASAVGLANRTAFTDKYPDTGAVDLGYHGTLLYPSEGSVTVTQATLTFNPGNGNDAFTLSANLKPGPASDGLQPGTNYAEVDFGTLQFILPAGGFQQQGGQWIFTGPGPVTSGLFQKLADGSVDLSVQVSGLSLSYSDSPIPILLRIGDDFGSSKVGLKGTLQFP